MDLMSKSFNSLIIGYGSVGSRHANNLLKLGYKNISVFRTFKNQLNYTMPKTVKIFENLKNLINLQKFKLVIIANPSSKHISHAIMAAKKKFNGI